jgi:hypothetical protein
MRAMIWMVATTIGGALGWWLGMFVGIFTAVSLSAVGSGVALFSAQRLANESLPSPRERARERGYRGRARTRSCCGSSPNMKVCPPTSANPHFV